MSSLKEEKRKRHQNDDSVSSKDGGSNNPLKRTRIAIETHASSILPDSSSQNNNKSSFARDMSHLPLTQKQCLKQYFDITDDFPCDSPTAPNEHMMMTIDASSIDINNRTTIPINRDRVSQGEPTSAATESSSAHSRKLAKRNRHGETLLMIAARKGDIKTIKQLLRESADVNACDYAGWSALHKCCSANHPRVVDLLLRHGAKVNHQGPNGETGLHDAARQGLDAVLDVLLRYKVDLAIRNKCGEMAIDVATETARERLQKVAATVMGNSPSLEENSLTICFGSDKPQSSSSPCSKAGPSDNISPHSNANSSGSGRSGTFSSSYTTNIERRSPRGRSAKISLLGDYKDPYAFDDDDGNGSDREADQMSNSPQTSSSTTTDGVSANGDTSPPKVPPLRIRLANQQSQTGNVTEVTPTEKNSSQLLAVSTEWTSFCESSRPASSADMTTPLQEEKSSPASPIVHEEESAIMSHETINDTSQNNNNLNPSEEENRSECDESIKKTTIMDTSSTGNEFAVTDSSDFSFREDDTNSSIASKERTQKINRTPPKVRKAAAISKAKQAAAAANSKSDSLGKDRSRKRPAQTATKTDLVILEVTETSQESNPVDLKESPSSEAKGQPSSNDDSTPSSGRGGSVKQEKNSQQSKGRMKLGKQAKRTPSRGAGTLAGAPSSSRSKLSKPSVENTVTPAPIVATNNITEQADSPSRRRTGRTLRSHTAAMREKECTTRKGVAPMKRRKFSRKRHIPQSGSGGEATSKKSSISANAQVSNKGSVEPSSPLDVTEDHSEDEGVAYSEPRQGSTHGSAGGQPTIKQEETDDEEWRSISGALRPCSDDISLSEDMKPLASIIITKADNKAPGYNPPVLGPPTLLCDAAANQSSNAPTSEFRPTFTNKDKLLTRMEMPPNPYKRALQLREVRDQYVNRLVEVRPKAPNGFEDYYLCTKEYLLGNQIPCQLKKRQVPQDLYSKPELCRLFQEQEGERFRLLLRQQGERDHLRLVAEQAVIRAQSKAALALSNQTRLLSACSAMASCDLSYITEDIHALATLGMDAILGGKSLLEEESSHLVSHDSISRFSAGSVIDWIEDIKEECNKTKKLILCRQLHESEALMTVQRMDWHTKLKELMLTPSLLSIYEGLGSPASGTSDLFPGSQIPIEHVPLVDVPNDFLLLPHDPLQKSFSC